MRDARDSRLPSATPGAPARRFVALILAAAGFGGVAGAQPPNDTCLFATQIFDGFNGLFSNSGAILFNTLPMCAPSNSDVWFLYQAFGPPEPRTFSTCGTGGSLVNTVLQVFDGTALNCAGPIPMGCNDDACGDRSSVTVDVTGFSIYLVRVADLGNVFNSEQGSFGIRVTGPPPPNDECTGATEVFTGGGGAVSYSNRFATDSGGAAAFCGIGYNSDVWFKWVATCTGWATFSTCVDPPPTVPYDPLPDTVIEVLSGTCGSLVGVGQNCNDNACGSNGLKSRVTLPVTAGTTYFIRVAEGGSTATYGSFTLGIDCCAGSFTSIPTGCGAPLTASGLPCLGGAVTYDVGFTFNFPVIWIGLPTSIPLCPPAPCALGASQLVVLPAFGFSVAIPNDPALSGLTLGVQAATFGPGGVCGPPLYGVNFTVSDTIVTTIG